MLRELWEACARASAGPHRCPSPALRRNADTLKRLQEAERALREAQQEAYIDMELSGVEKEKGNEAFKEQRCERGAAAPCRAMPCRWQRAPRPDPHGWCTHPPTRPQHLPPPAPAPPNAPRRCRCRRVRPPPPHPTLPHLPPPPAPLLQLPGGGGSLQRGAAARPALGQPRGPQALLQPRRLLHQAGRAERGWVGEGVKGPGVRQG